MRAIVYPSDAWMESKTQKKSGSSGVTSAPLGFAQCDTDVQKRASWTAFRSQAH
ncbi:hypothetical protein HO173_006738 [Letharia columbiana]|uniref:Uncharacterized protein n=1 Tax=Letharia columbiana TaxID=112416 RepID=A0A8H6FUW2_9LECA|nr:uncharacterized protein HO173_006738 [Letharia columbiana]KAF6235111.1 hypothetical protein HO173_006738 [Letharia columbiana]